MESKCKIIFCCPKSLLISVPTCIEVESFSPVLRRRLTSLLYEMSAASENAESWEKMGA